MYSGRSVDDPVGLKALVYGTFLVETVQTILAAYDSWNQLNLESRIATRSLDPGFLWITALVFTGFSELYLSA